MTFQERKVPELALFCTLQEENKILNIDWCPELVSCASCDGEKTAFVVFVGKQGYICMLEVEEGCLIYKHNIEIPYSYTCKITMLKLMAIKLLYNEKNKLTNGMYLFIGFDDGITSIYKITDTESNFPLTRIFKIKPHLERKQMVINVHVIEQNLLITTVLNVIIFRNIFLKDDNNQSSNSASKNNKSKQYKAQEQWREIPISQSKLNCEIDKNYNVYYIFNDTEGVVSYHISSNKMVKRVSGNVKVLCPCSNLLPKEQEILALGCTDDCVKFMNFRRYVVQKFTGFKNYPSYFEEDRYHNLLWVGCLDGSIACFGYNNQPGTIQKKKDSFTVETNKLTQLKKICGNGIKKLIVHKKTLIIFDCDHNIELYDIISTENESISFSNMADNET